jgi:ribosomal protein L32
MKVTKILLGTIIISMSVTAFAGIKDKKAMKTSEATLTTATADVKKACGNAKLDAKVDWASWGKYDYKKMGKKKDVVVGYAGSLIKSVLEEMNKLCKDADYKAELAKITSLKISGKTDQGDMYVAFKLDGTTLSMMLNADGYSSWKNADLLKAVWE